MLFTNRLGVRIIANRVDSFKGAYCTVWEKEACTDLFGVMDVMADTFPDMARKIVAASKEAEGKE